jgi:hypothetical protein
MDCQLHKLSVFSTRCVSLLANHVRFAVCFDTHTNYSDCPVDHGPTGSQAIHHF